ncbi:protein-tyrosine phosphatase domain-containing protein [Ditylenchus destructor]|nr:protein-tyrosine phosphatase domain-containing protein [Ditylenchus destructor]
MARRSSYFHNITGERARELLFLYGSKGEFLVRPSESNPADHTLSVHRGIRVTHVKIPFINGAHRLPNGQEFSTIEGIVDYIVRIPNLLSEKDGTFIDLTRPVFIPPSECILNSGYDRFFHINISGADAEDMLREEPNGTYLVRESTSNPGEYALSAKNDDAILHIRIYHNDGRFRVVPKDNFRSITDLLDNYIRLPMVQNGGNAVRLKTALLSTRFTAAAIDDRIDCLLKGGRKTNAKDGFIEEFEKLHREQDSHLFISCKEGRKPENVRKNRYRNVVPYDHTRIKLKCCGDESDYINANRIEILSENAKYAEFGSFKRRYISTQGCLQETVGDFWHMVWQENSSTIVMITKEVERGRVKCFRYWPEIDEEQCFSSCGEEFLVKMIKELHGDDYTLRTFNLRHKTRDPVDNGCPSNSILHFLEEVDRCVETNQTCSTITGPVVVHCSAGIGRTGTFIVLDILMNRIKRIGPHCAIDIPKTVRMLREQRATMVQTEAQYRFIYYAISAYMKLKRLRQQNESENGVDVDQAIEPISSFRDLFINDNETV